MAQTEQIMENEGVGELVVKTIRMLAKLSMQEYVIEEVVKYESNQLRR